MDCLDYQMAEARLERSEERTVKHHGLGDTVKALGIANSCIEEVTKGFVKSLEETSRGTEGDLKRLLKTINLDPEILSLCTLQVTLQGVALDRADITELCDTLGAVISDEVWAKQYYAWDKDKAAQAEAFVRRRNPSLRQRKTAIRVIARKQGFMVDRWPSDFRVVAGSWALDILLKTTNLFVQEVEQAKDKHRRYEVRYLTLAEEAVELATEAWEATVRQRPVYLSTAVPPSPWVAYDNGGVIPGQSFRPELVKRAKRSTRGLINAAIKSGQMQPVLDALNAIQATPWRINTRVLAVLQECQARGLQVDGLPRWQDFPSPTHPRPWAEMTEAERELWKRRKQETRLANNQRKSDLLTFGLDLTTAETLAPLDRFWTPCNLDWRGRVYPLPLFNFQRSDVVRSLFLFADGEPIGTEGLWWLKVHTANCGDFDKVSKRPFEERVRWTENNAAVIREIAENPLAERALEVWTKADKPFLFLAASMELATVLDHGVGTVTTLPVSWDGSCSGLQHLCAMTRAPEGALVNLTPQPEPQDVYQTVADKVQAAIQADRDNPLAQCCLAYGITRSVVKRNVMTYSYSSGKYGMGQQHRDDLMRPLQTKVLEGLYTEHPFGLDKGYSASIYLAGRVHAAIEDTVEYPARAMAFLQRLAKALAHEGKVLSWTTPAGLPWENRYHEPVTKRVRLYLHDRGVRVCYQASVATGDQREVLKSKAANAVAPNFVHACDAAHLMLTVNACVKEGIRNFALVHDSFGCLASQSAKMHRIVREQFVQMYETHDVLAEALGSAKSVLTQHNLHTLPDELQKGSLDLKGMLDAKYAFA